MEACPTRSETSQGADTSSDNNTDSASVQQSSHRSIASEHSSITSYGTGGHQAKPKQIVPPVPIQNSQRSTTGPPKTLGPGIPTIPISALPKSGHTTTSTSPSGISHGQAHQAPTPSFGIESLPQGLLDSTGINIPTSSQPTTDLVEQSGIPKANPFTTSTTTLERPQGQNVNNTGSNEPGTHGRFENGYFVQSLRPPPMK